MTKPIEKGTGASLFVLDDEGIFFFAPRQELYLFNTTATFLWCCLDEGLPASAIVQAYREAFGLILEHAELEVANTLHQWWGLGYIEDPSIPPASDISFTMAIGRLLCNASLRAEFTRSAVDVARKLRVQPDVMNVLCGLDPVQLEAQAKRMILRSGKREAAAPGANTLFSSLANPTQTLSEYAVGCRLRGLLQASIVRTYRLLNTRFRVRFGSADQEASVHPALCALADEPTSNADVCLDIMEGGQGLVILQGVVPVYHCRTLDELAPKLKGLIRQISLNRDEFLLELHAGVVSDGKHCVILPGAPGSGKTTLTAGLVHAGFEYFSDEVALLDKHSLQLRPVPLGLGIKPGAVDTLGKLFPDVHRLQVHTREDGQRVRYLNLPMAQTAPHETHRDAKWLIFPTYGRGLTTELKPIGRPAAMRRLMQEIMVVPKPLDETDVEALVRWARQLLCFELPLSSLSDAISLVSEQCQI